MEGPTTQRGPAATRADQARSRPTVAPTSSLPARPTSAVRPSSIPLMPANMPPASGPTRPASSVRPSSIPQAPEKCPQTSDRDTQRAVSPAPVNGVPTVVHSVLSSPSLPLDAGSRTFMEARFGHDFSHVRMHTDQRAMESTRAVNALAYTVGNHIVFGTRQFAFSTDVGRRLLAHELAHVVQYEQSGSEQHISQQQPIINLGQEGDVEELEAQKVANEVTTGHKTTIRTFPLRDTIILMRGPPPIPSTPEVSLFSNEQLEQRSDQIYEQAMSAFKQQKGKSVTPKLLGILRQELTVGVLQGLENGKVVTMVNGNDPRFAEFVKASLKPGEEYIDSASVIPANVRTGEPRKSGHINVHSEQVLAAEADVRGVTDARVGTSNNACNALCMSNLGENYPKVLHVNPAKPRKIPTTPTAAEAKKTAGPPPDTAKPATGTDVEPPAAGGGGAGPAPKSPAPTAATPAPDTGAEPKPPTVQHEHEEPAAPKAPTAEDEIAETDTRTPGEADGPDFVPKAFRFGAEVGEGVIFSLIAEYFSGKIMQYFKRRALRSSLADLEEEINDYKQVALDSSPPEIRRAFENPVWPNIRQFYWVVTIRLSTTTVVGVRAPTVSSTQPHLVSVAIAEKERSGRSGVHHDKTVVAPAQHPVIVLQDSETVTYSQPIVSWGGVYPPVPTGFQFGRSAPALEPQVDPLRFASTGEIVTTDSLYSWAKGKYPRMFADPNLVRKIQSSNEFTGSENARSRALEALMLKLREEEFWSHF